MRALAEALGVVTILVVFWDAFETLILPRRVSRRLRLARIYFRTTWGLWGRASTIFRSSERRENYLSFYGPLSLLFLVAIWAVGMSLGFALLQWGGGRTHPAGSGSFATLLYLSATTFFTLGIGDITPANSFARMVTGVEAGAGFAFLALVLAAVGTYGVIAYGVVQRTREIGVRLALGAQPGQVVGAVVGQGLGLACVGVGLGLAGAWGATRVLTGMLFEVTPTDPATLGAGALLLTVVTAVASYLPARRAARIDPVAALRAD